VLSELEKREINRELPHLPNPRAACLEALNVVQRHRGWVSDNAVDDIAAFLGMTPVEVDSVATFYSLIFRKPVGRHVILLCDSISCWVTGGNALRDQLLARLGIGFGETTADGRVTLLPVACLGACDRAPAMMVDDELIGPLTPALVERIVADLRLGAS
jgi:NADH-quinone oxidoreductase subunit E